MKIHSIWLFSLVALVSVHCCAQQKPIPKKSACDDTMKFCWYDDEVQAWGQRWVSQEKKDTLEVSVAFRCLKSLGVCIQAHSHKFSDTILTSVELMPVTHWDNQQITAKAENYDGEPCDLDTYVINRVDRTVLLISSSGPMADTSACTNIFGKPRTLTFKLSQ